MRVDIKDKIVLQLIRHRIALALVCYNKVRYFMGEVPTTITSKELQTLAIATVAGPLLRREVPSVFREV